MTNLTVCRDVMAASFGSVSEPGPMTPVFLEGAPGGGKTQVVKDFARDMDVGFVFLPASTLRPEDLSVPDVLSDGSLFNYKIFQQLPVIGNDSLPERGILLVDELPQADFDVQKFIGQVAPPNSAAGTFRMKPGWLIVATGNRREDKAGANKLLTHMLDRFILLTDVEPTLKEWTEYSFKSGDFHEAVVAFHNSSEGRYLNNFDPSNAARKTPTFRGWTSLSRFLDKGLSPKVIGHIGMGIVGEAAASQFQAFLSLAAELPDPDYVLESTENAEAFDIPSTIAKRWFLCSAIGRKASADNAAAVMVALNRLTGKGHEDMLVMGLITARDFGRGFSRSEQFRDAVLSGVFDSLSDPMGV